MTKQIKKLLSILILVSFIFSSVNIVKAEGEEDTDEVNVDYSIPTVAKDSRVRLLTDSEKYRKKQIKVKVDNWPHTHKLGTGSLVILHKPAWMYLNDNKVNCEEVGATYFIVNDKGEKIRKISLNCSIVFKDEEKTKELVKEVFKDVEENNKKETEVNTETEEEKKADEEISTFIDDLLGKNSSNELKTVRLKTKIFTISGKKMAKSVKSYSINKEKLFIGEYSEINGLKNREYYNSAVAKIFTKFSTKVEINKFRNEFAKNLSTIAFSFNSYQDENLDYETRDFFRKKFVNDLKKLEISYTKIQNKENRIKDFFFKK